jgi:hypothetical protein
MIEISKQAKLSSSHSHLPLSSLAFFNDLGFAFHLYNKYNSQVKLKRTYSLTKKDYGLSFSQAVDCSQAMSILKMKIPSKNEVPPCSVQK